MDRGTTYPLNPVDNIMLATHESLRRRGYCGLNVMLVIDAEGPLPPEKLAAAVRRLGEMYPALSARIRYSRLWRRAMWHIDPSADSGEAPDRGTAITYEHHPFAPNSPETPDAAMARANEYLRRVIDVPLDPTTGPQLHLVHVEIAPNRHRLGLRWPHHLMDLEGGHLLLGALHAILSGQTPKLDTDPRAVLPAPFRRSRPVALARALQGLWHHAQYCMNEQPRLVAKPKDERRTCHFESRHYDAAFVKAYEAAAKRRSAKGPLLYTRTLMVAMAQTYLEMATERGRPREYLMFTQSLPLPRPGPRPGVHGNHVVLPWISLPKSDIPDWTKCDQAALAAFLDYVNGNRTETAWQLFRGTQTWPFPLARALVTHRIPRGAAVFTSYRFDDSVTQLGEANITNLSGAGPPNCHPGWLLGNTRYGDTMTISISFFQDYVDPPSVTEFLDRLERKLIEGPEA